MRTNLYDTFVIDGVRRTDDGYLAAFAKVARTGIQEYRGSELGRPDLDRVKVYRPPEEVFHADAMKSFAHRPVTLSHPRQMVNSKNWKKFSKGQTGAEVVRDGEFIRVPMVMMDQGLIDAYEQKKIKQLSMGYTCDLKWEPGTTPRGEVYDAIQTAIRGNHLAVVPTARGGDQLNIGDDGSWRALVDRLKQDTEEQDPDDPDDDDDENYTGDVGSEDDEEDEMQDAWSDEARAAALAARQANAKSTPAGARGSDGHHLVPGGQGQDKEGAADHPLNRTIRNAGYKYSHSTPIHKMSGETVMHHTYEKGEHKSNPGSSVMDTHKVSVANGSDKWTTSTGGGSGRRVTGEGEHSLDKHLASKAKRYKELRDSSISDEDYVSCPQCGEDVPSNTSKCPDCGAYVSPTKDGVDTMPKVIIVDGLPVSIVDEQGATIVDRHISKLEKKIKDGKTATTDIQTALDKANSLVRDAQTVVGAKDGEIAVLKQQLKDAEITPEKLDVMVKDRMAVIDRAAPILGKAFVYDGLKVEDIRRAAVSAKLGDAAKGMDDSAISGAFAALSASSGSSNNNGTRQFADALRGQSHHVVNDATTTRDAAFAEAQKNLQNAWKTPVKSVA